MLSFKIYLLTHFKEIPKKSNTGRLVLDLLGEAAEQICWNRMNPPNNIVEEIEKGGVVLVYPGAEGEETDDLTGISQFIIIDGTWHEARRIHQRSPYLLKARRINLKPSEESRYNLRKNQKKSGLCTAECVIQILRAKGHYDTAELLEERFLAYMRPESAISGRLESRCLSVK